MSKVSAELVSLKDRPATKEDIGKTFYWVDTTKRTVEIREIKVQDFDDDGRMVLFDNGKGIFTNVEYVYRNKPILISEQEYNELNASRTQAEARIEKAIAILKDGETYAPTCRCIKAREVLEGK